MTNIYFKQETIWTCGVAAMRIALAAERIDKTEKQIVRLLGTNKIRGTWHKGFSEAAKKLRLNYLVIRNSSLKEISKLLKDGYKIIVCYYILKDKVDHYAIVKKITKKSIILADPFYGDNHKIRLKYFIKNWKSDPRWDNEKKWCFALKNKTKNK